MPEAMRGASLASPESGTSGTTRPRRVETACAEGPPPTPPPPSTSSTIVFHSPHPSQRPAQRAVTEPQF